MWTCTCGIENGQRARSCESCGAERVGESKGQPSVSTCEWQSFGSRRCLMPGSASLDGKRWLCSWHLDSLRSPRTVDDWEEFGRWIAAMLEASVCCEWTHWGSEALWAAVRGLRALSGYRQPCRQPLCPHRAVEDWHGTPAEAIARIRRDLGRIGTAIKAPGGGHDAADVLHEVRELQARSLANPPGAADKVHLLTMPGDETGRRGAAGGQERADAKMAAAAPRPARF